MYIFSSEKISLRIVIDSQNIIVGNKVNNAPISIHPTLVEIDKFIKSFIWGTDLSNQKFHASLREFISKIEIITTHNSIMTSNKVDGKCKIVWTKKPASGPGIVFYYSAIQLNNFVIYNIIKQKIIFGVERNGEVDFHLGAIEYAKTRFCEGSREINDASIITEIEMRAKEGSHKFVLTLGCLEINEGKLIA